MIDQVTYQASGVGRMLNKTTWFLCSGQALPLVWAPLRLAGGRASQRATFPAPVKASPNLMGFHLSRPGALLLSYEVEKRGQGWFGMGAGGET